MSAARSSRPLAVVAVGGNALIIDPSHTSIPDQFEAACRTAEHVVDLIRSGWRVVLTHGNGPQVGFVLRRSELAAAELPPVPMTYAGADIQGAVGYMLITALNDAFVARGMDMPVASLVTRVRVGREDPAFTNPSKPIGTWFTKERAEELAANAGWVVREDAGRGWRRVVPSPAPVEIVDLKPISLLIDHDFTVVACGGGGIPVVSRTDGRLEGIDAVIDKDYASSLLARALGADAFIICTGVPHAAIHFNTPQQRDLGTISPEEAERYLREGHFHAGSMLPKVTAVLQFVRESGGLGVITDAEHLADAAAGRAGTRIAPLEEPRS